MYPLPVKIVMFVVFTAIMTGLGAIFHAAWPPLHEWILTRYGHGGVWIMFGVIAAGCLFVVWRDYRRRAY